MTVRQARVVRFELSDGRIAAFLDDEKNFGIRGPESCVSAGGNAKMSEFQAAMGLCNLRHFDEVLEKRKVLTERYLSRLEGRVRILSPREGVTPNYAYMPVLMPGRDAAFQRLAAKTPYLIQAGGNVYFCSGKKASVDKETFRSRLFSPVAPPEQKKGR